MNTREQPCWSARRGLSHLVQEGLLTSVNGIGKATAAVITELVSTGGSTLHHAVRGAYPSSLVELGDVPGLSRKQIRRLHDLAGIRSVAELQAACRTNQLVTVRGIGPKVQAKLLAALGEYQRGQGYRLYGDVLEEVSKLEKDLKGLPGVQAVTVTGALRRKMEVINEYCFVVCCDGVKGPARLVEGLGTTPILVMWQFKRPWSRQPLRRDCPSQLWWYRAISWRACVAGDGLRGSSRVIAKNVHRTGSQ